MVDCRSLVEFCRAFEHHKKRNQMASSSTNQFCDHSPFAAAIDVVILLSALVALGFLTLPCFTFIFHEALQILPPALDLVGEVISDEPIAYASGVALAFVLGIAAWVIIDHKTRKCGKANCRGLRRSVEFDIQLETEERVKNLPPPPRPLEFSKESSGVELGEGHRELEAELKKMAPVNGRTVLIFRAPCGCPAGRLEVWGNKKVRRINK